MMQKEKQLDDIIFDTVKLIAYSNFTKENFPKDEDTKVSPFENLVFLFVDQYYRQNRIAEKRLNYTEIASAIERTTDIYSDILPAYDNFMLVNSNISDETQQFILTRWLKVKYKQLKIDKDRKELKQAPTAMGQQLTKVQGKPGISGQTSLTNKEYELQYELTEAYRGLCNKLKYNFTDLGLSQEDTIDLLKIKELPEYPTPQKFDSIRAEKPSIKSPSKEKERLTEQSEQVAIKIPEYKMIADKDKNIDTLKVQCHELEDQLQHEKEEYRKQLIEKDKYIESLHTQIDELKNNSQDDKKLKELYENLKQEHDENLKRLSIVQDKYIRLLEKLNE